MMTKKKLSLFYKVYFSILAVFAISLTIFLFALNNNLKEYNKGIPETVSEQFFNEVFIKKDTAKIVQMSGFIPSEFESQDDITTFIDNRLSGNLSFTSVSNAGDTTAKKYIVKSGEYKLATFFLKCGDNGDYYVDTLSLHLPKDVKKTVKILNSSSLYINGIQVGEEYLVSQTPHESASYLPENVDAPTWNTYEITGLTKEPEITVTDRNSANPELLDVNGVLTEQLVYDEQEEEICSRILEGAKLYAACMQNDIPKGRVFPYFEKGSAIYDGIRTVETRFAWDHSGYTFENENVSEFMRYDENTISVRISFTHVLKMYGRDDFRDAFDVTYFARNIDGIYKIFASHNN